VFLRRRRRRRRRRQCLSMQLVEGALGELA
jgi:hypothetical protein